MKIKQIAEDLRAMGIRNNWLIVTATQINRNGYNSSDISMTDVAESAGLSHTGAPRALLASSELLPVLIEVVGGEFPFVLLD